MFGLQNKIIPDFTSRTFKCVKLKELADIRGYHQNMAGSSVKYIFKSPGCARA